MESKVIPLKDLETYCGQHNWVQVNIAVSSISENCFIPYDVKKLAKYLKNNKIANLEVYKDKTDTVYILQSSYGDSEIS